MKKGQLQVISGRAHPRLAKEVANLLDTKLHPVELSNFANGEVRCHLGESVRGHDVFVLQTHAGPNINEAMMEQAIIVDAAKRASARSISAVCPFLGYARQDRKGSGREPITARLVVDILAAAGADRIMSVDLHAGQIQGFFDGPFDHMIARPVIVKYIKENYDTTNMVIVSPDAGRVKSTERYASQLACDIAIIHKHRQSATQKTEAKYLIGDVKGKMCLIVDDMIDTGGTIVAAADILKEHGAKKIFGVTTHGVFSGSALERIEKSSFDKVIATDTLPLPKQKSKKIVTLSVAPLISDAIRAVYEGESLSALFDGMNQF